MSREIKLREFFTFDLTDLEHLTFESGTKKAVTLLAKGKNKKKDRPVYYFVTLYDGGDSTICTEIDDYAKVVENYGVDPSNRVYCFPGKLCGQKRVVDDDVLLPEDFKCKGPLMAHIIEHRSQSLPVLWEGYINPDAFNKNLEMVGKRIFYNASGNMFAGPYSLKMKKEKNAIGNQRVL